MVRTHLDVKEIVWAFTQKLKDVFHIVSISFDEVSDRPTTLEHHGGDLDSLDGYDNIPKRY